MWRGGLANTVERLAVLDVATLSNAEALDALAELRGVQSWVEGRTAALRRQVSATALSPMVGRADADHVSRSSRGSGARDERRADALGKIPELHAALDAGYVTGEHVDAVATALADLNAGERQLLAERGGWIVEAATTLQPDTFRESMRELVAALQADRGVSLRARRKRNTRLAAWFDKHTGMWSVHGRLDPELGCIMNQQLEAALHVRLAMPTPEFCPSDPKQKVDFLRAYGLADLFAAAGRGRGDASSGGPRAEVTIVVSATSHGVSDGVSASGSGGAPASEVRQRRVSTDTWVCPPGVIDAGSGATVAPGFVTDLVRRGVARLFTVVTYDGQVVSAPGRLALGRTTRLANRAQRRALHALYPTCAMPGCLVDFRLCRLHHVVWWRHGGRTDLDNMVPLCGTHHRAVHDEGWIIALGPRREVTITRPDGVVLTTGPPGRGP